MLLLPPKRLSLFFDAISRIVFHILTSHSLPAHSNLARPLHSWKMLFRCPWTSTALVVFTAPSPRHLSPGLCRPTPVPPCPLATLQTSLQAPPLLLGPLTSPVPQNVDLYRLLPSHGLWSLHDADPILTHISPACSLGSISIPASAC